MRWCSRLSSFPPLAIIKKMVWVLAQKKQLSAWSSLKRDILNMSLKPAVLPGAQRKRRRKGHNKRRGREVRHVSNPTKIMALGNEEAKKKLAAAKRGSENLFRDGGRGRKGMERSVMVLSE